MIEVKMSGDRDLSIYINGLGAKTYSAARHIVDRGAIEVKRQAVYNVSNRILHRVSGKLAGAFIIGRGDMLAERSPFAMVGNTAAYAPQREFGGTIRARRSKFLAIPLPGVVGSPRDYQDTFIRRGIIFQGGQSAKGNRGWIKPLFVLKRQVTQIGHPFLGPALVQSLPEINRISQEEFDKLTK
jgi:hypothetical protein